MVSLCAAVFAVLLAGASASPDVVYVVFANHLDVGFNHGEDASGEPCLNPPYDINCGWAYSVVNNYFDNFFPAAISTAIELRER